MPEGNAPDQQTAQTASQGTVINPRLAPQDLEAERSVLGGILLTNDALYDAIEDLTPHDFYRAPHATIFAAMKGLAERGEPIDSITLADELRKMGQLEDVGGLPYLNSLDAAIPATANIGRYARIVREKAQLRAVIGAATAIARDGYQQLGKVDEFLDQVEQRIFDVTDRRGATPFKWIGGKEGLVARGFGQLEQLYERNADITGIPCGIVGLDRLTAGFQRGDLIIVAGRPSMGKTALAMGFASYVATGGDEQDKAKREAAQKPVAVFEMEMSAEALTMRLFASEGRVDGQRLRTGKLLDSDWPKLARAADRLVRAPMAIDDTPANTTLQIRAKCRRLKVERGELGLVVVDYLQLMHQVADSREQEVAALSRGLKELARELSVPVIALSQLNRSLERRDDKRPMLSDLRESGGIEQDADVILFVYRDEVYNKASPDKGIAEIIVGKQRNGPIGTVRTAFLRDYTRFENLADDRGEP